ncbi:hypothetical protein IW261DRAFT_803584 [Armillaria novae-zelandiae]|uniref:Uncharacterized protein n=1 Tax=Armillaria novae-zelandiae TaxID=153914 RepID=A0AA39UEU3_9AGAR|nr:hypothetical protein IW261DRAFT_803584 [Armillaria novae-zelandiae]
MPYYGNNRLSESELSGRNNIPRHPRCRRGPKGIRQPQVEARISLLRQCTHPAILRRTLAQKIAATDIVPNLLGDTVLDPLGIVPDLQLTFVMTKLVLLCLTPTTAINPRKYQDAEKEGSGLQLEGLIDATQLPRHEIPSLLFFRMDIMGVLTTYRNMFRANIVTALIVHVTFPLQVSIIVWYNMIKQT